MSVHRLLRMTLTLAAAGLACAPATAASEGRAAGKLLLTNGITNVDGAAGGGISTWAIVAGNETVDGIGGSVHVSDVPLADYNLLTYGAAIGIKDRLELSYARQHFDTRAVGTALGLGHGFTFNQDIYGVKLRLIGDAVYDQDSILPQIAVGAQYHHADRGAVIHFVGGEHADGTDFYVAATKLLLGQSLLLNGTVRFTKANQFGLLGFGGDRHGGYSAEFEGAVGLMLSRRFIVGGEFRSKPDNLGFAKEDDVFDLYAAYAIHHNVTLTAAYVDLGEIATVKGQRGAFLSLQASF